MTEIHAGQTRESLRTNKKLAITMKPKKKKREIINKCKSK